MFSPKSDSNVKNRLRHGTSGAVEMFRTKLQCEMWHDCNSIVIGV